MHTIDFPSAVSQNTPTISESLPDLRILSNKVGDRTRYSPATAAFRSIWDGRSKRCCWANPLPPKP